MNYLMIYLTQEKAKILYEGLDWLIDQSPDDDAIKGAKELQTKLYDFVYKEKEQKP